MERLKTRKRNKQQHKPTVLAQDSIQAWPQLTDVKEIKATDGGLRAAIDYLTPREKQARRRAPLRGPGSANRMVVISLKITLDKTKIIPTFGDIIHCQPGLIGRQVHMLPEIFHSQDAGFDEESPPELLKVALYEIVTSDCTTVQKRFSMVNVCIESMAGKFAAYWMISTTHFLPLVEASSLHSTGMPPYLARDFLKDEGMSHLYRHDLETLFDFCQCSIAITRPSKAALRANTASNLTEG
ncbi:hypothetical protein ARMGADRAFT_1064987 [Armillaria gallica]|uniref:Uncharacterized protein n=1 Tax=Armillaria gallica TaxID=47427 RepID=A0A2H3D2W8_ARMGA|nr:hypothetical protein ARMGADRAFT_1064987 [Armillaria gallica]